MSEDKEPKVTIYGLKPGDPCVDAQVVRIECEDCKIKDAEIARLTARLHFINLKINEFSKSISKLYKEMGYDIRRYIKLP